MRSSKQEGVFFVMGRVSQRVQEPPEDDLGGEMSSREWSNWRQRRSSGWSWALSVHVVLDNLIPTSEGSHPI